MTESLTPYQQEQRARAEQWLPSVMARAEGVTSADKAFAWMREHDIYVPRATVREVWREVIRGAEHIDIVNRLPWVDRVPRDWMEQTGFQYGHTYNYMVRVGEMRDKDGVLQDVYVTVTSEENLTIGEVLADATDAAFNYGINTVDPGYAPTIDVIKYRPGVR